MADGQVLFSGAYNCRYPDIQNYIRDIFQMAASAQPYKIGQEATTRWGHWRIDDAQYADEAQQIPTLVVKTITVNAGESLSAQAHFGRGETYECLSGVLYVCVEGEIVKLEKGDSVQIPRGALHFSYVSTNATEPAIFKETQEGPLCAESDIVRGADRRKLNLPSQLNPKKDHRNQSVIDIILEQRLMTAFDRYEKEVLQGGKKAEEFDVKYDFMPTFLALAERFKGDVTNPDFKEALKAQYTKDIKAHLALHEKHTPELPPEVLRKLQLELKVA